MVDLLCCLEELSSAAGVGGMPETAETAARWLRQYCDDVQLDALGSVIGWIRCGKPQAPVLMLEAHIDEVGLIVTQVDDGGFVRVSSCGGVDVRALPAAEVLVYGDQPYAGVFCSVPPHLRKSDDKNSLPDLADMGIDVGMSTEEARQHIQEGNRIGYRPNFRRMNEHCVCGKSMDDRAGVASILCCLDVLKQKPTAIDYDIAVVFAVQEELGCRGSAVSAYRVAPDYAIAVDVSFAYTPDADRTKCGTLGKGPMIGWSPTLDDTMTRELVALAQQVGIPYQHEVMGGSTGTDAESIADARAGTRTALLSVPLRYMHTPQEMMDIRDVEWVGKLMAAWIEKGVSAQW